MSSIATGNEAAVGSMDLQAQADIFGRFIGSWATDLTEVDGSRTYAVSQLTTELREAGVPDEFVHRVCDQTAQIVYSMKQGTYGATHA
jgi:hypothetical protein